MRSEDRRQRVNQQGQHRIVDQYLHVLAGERISPPIILHDPEDGLPKLFFVFPDLGVRITGKFVLQCRIVNLQKYSILIQS